MADEASAKISDAWIFVSHSHQDLAAVRHVRDEIERQNANPLLFFLLCLKEDEEVSDLIKREISARNFFVLCDSDAARGSKWVQKERQFVESLPDRKVYRLDLSWPWEKQLRVIGDALAGATTFINYAYRDRDRVRPYIDLLVRNDFAVFDYVQMTAGASWSGEITHALRSARNGYFVTMLSRAWVDSTEALTEFLRYLALTSKRPIVVTLDPLASISRALPAKLRELPILDFSVGDAASHERELLSALELVRVS
jgi:hypothetical protein